MRYFIANWKANKNLNEALGWIDKFLSLELFDDHKKIVICPPTPLIYPLKEKIKGKKNICLGSQDISVFEEGTFTGEVTAKTLSGLIDYAIIGHSERLKNFFESDDTNYKKIRSALKYNINPLLCVRDENIKIPPGVKHIVYEPPWAISKGLEDSLDTTIEVTPEKAIAVRKTLNIADGAYFIYGGSVNPNNIKEYSKFPQIDGVLVGGASLDPEVFSQIINLSLS
ncbi:hypothetical protein A2954_07695 [Candidatus Roizmanbacteria bacterium RIFCSPLOWO2_01_FULL_37_12]|uniref:Triosephosphate isomerase n=1 Tax=Candidatus Roizmanbacteria bacterium RIFCSPLOWO2_01_FULL_37_12 TaxID=1802056 RepID=A0A1F7I828_9BACT|nr:MAG: hypothetical protein A3D76_01600 [Candidatus Roizmanbacteria bacterium RIFCSPHIGHO2_02_FULL_37_9b]OGK39537.1 MAG: hypothetical protein A2954_07695 [Candidatus Roizmanbacteria bacterium RIFCSPLOWO2_01_FULL_37_12]